MKSRNLKDLAIRVQEINKNWWIDLETGERIVRNINELKALAITELCEAIEGERKDLMDDHLPHRKMAEVEMADTYIRILDLMIGHGIYSTANIDIQPFELTNKAEYIFYIIKFITHSDFNNLNLHVALCHIELYCARFGYDLWTAIDEKLVYNQQRKDHSIEERKKSNGKKF